MRPRFSLSVSPHRLIFGVGVLWPGSHAPKRHKMMDLPMLAQTKMPSCFHDVDAAPPGSSDGGKACRMQIPSCKYDAPMQELSFAVLQRLHQPCFDIDMQATSVSDTRYKNYSSYKVGQNTG